VGTDLDAGAGAVDPAKPPRVLCSSTRVFVLNAVANRVFIFDTSPALALYTTFDETEEFRDIAVTADGTWLFVAAPTRVWAAKVPTLTGTPTVDQIAEADAPTRVAVSGDGLRLFVGTDAKTVHLFLIQETPVAFPEVGSGVSVTDTIVSMAASDAGEWLYVLGNDASGKGQIRVVDGDQIDPSPATAVGNPVPAGDTPEEILLDPTGRWLYVVFNGTASAPCAGAAIFHLTEKDCEGILWKALDGCPECADPSCLLLAAVSDYSLGATVTDNRIDNRVRPLAPSTETLRELIECCCHAKSETGAKGPRGDAGMAATVAVGTTTTGVPGTSATVSNSGTSSAAVLDFVINAPNLDSWGDYSVELSGGYWLSGRWLEHLWFLATLIVYVVILFGVQKLWPSMDLMIRRIKPGFSLFLAFLALVYFASAHVGHAFPPVSWAWTSFRNKCAAACLRSSRSAVN